MPLIKGHVFDPSTGKAEAGRTLTNSGPIYTVTSRSVRDTPVFKRERDAYSILQTTRLLTYLIPSLFIWVHKIRTTSTALH